MGDEYKSLDNVEAGARGLKGVVCNTMRKVVKVYTLALGTAWMA